MPLRITQRSESEVPMPTAMGKVNEDVEAIKVEMRRLGSGMVLEIEVGDAKGVRGTKLAISKAAKQIGSSWKHWNAGNRVFAKPAEPVRRRGRRSKTEV